MAQDRTDPSGQISEADLLDQQVSLDPRPLTGTDTLPPGTGTPSRATEDARPLTQHQPATDGRGRDEYPRAAAGVGWS